MSKETAEEVERRYIKANIDELKKGAGDVSRLKINQQCALKDIEYLKVSHKKLKEDYEDTEKLTNRIDTKVNIVGAILLAILTGFVGWLFKEAL